ncbi:hypothetical protein CL628_00675 [bacterium]|nr:hypothetical protein [bacterium]
MRILIFNFEYPPLGGGGGVATKDLAQELAKDNEVHVITTAPSRQLKESLGDVPIEEVSGNLHVHRVPVIGRTQVAVSSLISMLTFVPTAGWYGWRLTTRVQFDVINAQFAVPSGLPAALVARLRSIPFVLSFIGGDLYDPSKGVSPHRHPILRWLIRRIAAQATVATAISEDTKRRARELHSVTLPIEVTHIGLVPRKFGTASRAQLKLPEAAQLAVTVGRLIPRKGYRELLAAWADVPEAHLAIIGDGPLRDELTSLAESLGITDRVRLLGYQSEEIKAQVLRAADYYVSAAQHEGFGIVFLEAMAAGLPIVATNNGGHTDFLTTQRNALLVPPGNKEELVKALARLTADTNLQTSMAAANKEDVREFYVDKTSARFMNVLRGAIERG